MSKLQLDEKSHATLMSAVTDMLMAAQHVNALGGQANASFALPQPKPEMP